MAGKLALSVSQLNAYVRRMFQLDPILHSIELRGEISNLKFHQTGTLFFTLKDEEASIACVMYADDAALLTLKPFEGMKVIAQGSVSLYVKGGQYQFYAKSIQAQGVGVLYEQLMRLKSKLSEEGLFERERKKPIPRVPDTIGVVTSPTGAVIHDILNVSLRRDPEVRLLLYPVRVQGIGAAQEVADAIAALDAMAQVDTIIVARGGGSMEDLWTFNEESVVRAVAACTKPILSAVGHETDVTLCDLAADQRVPTPSAAAECAVAERRQLCDEVANMVLSLRNAMSGILDEQARLLDMMKIRLQGQSPAVKLVHLEQQLAMVKRQLHSATQNQLSRYEERLRSAQKSLALLDPYAMLDRGYAIVMRENEAVSSADQLNTGDAVQILMTGGKVEAQITGKAMDA